MNSNEPFLTPALIELLNASLILKTTNSKVLAAHLKKSPATVRTEFQRILSILNVHCRFSALRKDEENGWLPAPAGERAHDDGASRVRGRRLVIRGQSTLTDVYKPLHCKKTDT